MRKTVTILGVAVLTGASIALWPVTPASAQEMAVASGYHYTVSYLAAEGQVNDVTITNGADHTEYIIDDIVPIRVNGTCTHPDEADLTRVTCTVEDVVNPMTLNVTLLDMDDTLDAHTAEWEFAYGGEGDDTLTGAGGALRNDFYGDEGDDTLSGALYQSGGDGQDTLTGTGGDDFLTGDVGSDTLFGEGGADELRGRGGSDELHGGDGNDGVYGDRGTDTLFGDGGDDVLYGGRDADQLDGGPGNDEEHQDW
jgi:serralysin